VDRALRVGELSLTRLSESQSPWPMPLDCEDVDHEVIHTERGACESALGRSGVGLTSPRVWRLLQSRKSCGQGGVLLAQPLQLGRQALDGS
jgi:hypothetical protein